MFDIKLLSHFAAQHPGEEAVTQRIAGLGAERASACAFADPGCRRGGAGCVFAILIRQ
jgi:hypothetical protein